MTYSEHYGATSYDNFYGFTFKLAGGQVNEGDVSDKTMENYGGQLKYAWEKFEEIINQPHIDDYVMNHGGRMHIAWDSLLPDDDPYHRNHELYDAICQYLSDDNVEVRAGSNEWIVTFPDLVNESSRFGFNIGDKVELTKDKVNSISGDVFEAGTQGEVVAVDKPMKGVIKVKIEGGKVISVPERGIKVAGTDNEPWKTLAANRPPEPKRHVRPERPEDYYMRPTTYGSPRYTGD